MEQNVGVKPRAILVILPILRQPVDAAPIIASLQFLSRYYRLDYVDPVQSMDTIPNDLFYSRWRDKIQKSQDSYAAFFGFSFGGVILQQCFSLFEQSNKPIVLLSTPSYAAPSLMIQLNQMISFCKNNQLEEAIRCLYTDLLYPSAFNAFPSYSEEQRVSAIARLTYGYTRLLMTDSRPILKNTSVKYIHLLGEQSRLVKQEHVLTAKAGQLVVVPDAGMRVLQDNPTFCQKIILEKLPSG